MHVSKLITNNFKSYKGRHEFGPFNKYTAIIGTNASGKSNLFDALCFVLGAPSDIMRCSEMKNLIWAGEDPSADATVELIVTKNGTPLKFSRKVDISNQIYYFYNNCEVTLNEYKSHLKNYGFHNTFQSYIIFQGDISFLSSMPPKDLTKFIEDLSGSSSLKDDYVLALKEFSTLQSKISKQEKEYDEIAYEVENIKRQAAEVNKYNLLQQKIDSETLELNNFLLYQYISKYKEANNSIIEENEKKNSLVTEKDSLGLELDQVQARSKELMNRIKMLKRQELELRIDYDDKVLSIKIFDKELEELNNKIEDTKSAINQKNKSLTSEMDQKKILSEQVKEFDENFKIIIENEPLIKSIINESQIYNKEAENLIKQTEIVESIKSKLNEKQQLIFHKQSMINDIHIPEMIEKPEQLDYEEYERRKTQIEESIKKQNDYMESYKRMKKNGKQQERINRLIMSLRSIDGVHGHLRNLIKPIHQMYEKAILSALTPHLDDIIVDSVDIACKCIKICKKLDLGNASYIPLDKISYKVPSSSVTDPISKYIVFDDKYAPAIFHLTNGIVLCQSQESAIEMYKSKMYRTVVDMNGNLYKSNGLISGGFESEDDYFGNIPEKEEVVKKINEYEEELNRLKTEHDININKQNKANELYTNYMKNMDICVNRKQTLEEEINKLQLVMNEMFDNLNKESEKLDKIRDKYDFINSKNILKMCERKEFLNKKYKSFFETIDIECFQQLQNIFTKYLERLEDITYTKKQLACINLSNLENDVYNLKQQLGTYQEKQNSLQVERDSLSAEVDAKFKLLDDLRKTLGALIQARDSLENEKCKLNLKVKKLKNSIKQIENNLSSKKSIVETNKRRIDDIMTESQFNTIDEVINFDFSSILQRTLHRVMSDERLIKLKKMKISAIDKLREKMNGIEPNFEAVDTFEEMEQRRKEKKKALKKTRIQYSMASDKFNEIKKRRTSMFMSVFSKIKKSVADIYPILTSTDRAPLGGNALLSLENEKEPYKGGVEYTVIPPNKRNQTLDSLSGGEQTLAVVSLVFSINRAIPSPCFILDEIDAALDYRNVISLSAFLQSQCNNQQIIIISHKPEVFSGANSLLGICRNVDSTSKGLYILFDEDDEEPEPLNL